MVIQHMTFDSHLRRLQLGKSKNHAPVPQTDEEEGTYADNENYDGINSRRQKLKVKDAQIYEKTDTAYGARSQRRNNYTTPAHMTENVYDVSKTDDNVYDETVTRKVKNNSKTTTDDPAYGDSKDVYAMSSHNKNGMAEQNDGENAYDVSKGNDSVYDEMQRKQGMNNVSNAESVYEGIWRDYFRTLNLYNVLLAKQWCITNQITVMTYFIFTDQSCL